MIRIFDLNEVDLNSFIMVEGIGGFFLLILVILIAGAAIGLLRLIGAWMLRIDEVIEQQKTTNQLLRQMLGKDEDSET